MNKKLMFSSSTAEWETPPKLFNALNKIYRFNLDVCATAKNTKCKKYFSKKEDGIRKSWNNKVCFMNPPYGSEISAWVSKACYEVMEYKCPCVVALLPARTDTIWYHKYVRPYAQVYPIMGRVKFLLNGKPVLDKKGKPTAAPFPSLIAIWFNIK